MTSWKKFLDSIASFGGSVVVLFVLHTVLLIALILGYVVLKDSYFLVLGALLGLLKGEFKSAVVPPPPPPIVEEPRKD
jgi:hypothetical protein